MRISKVGVVGAGTMGSGIAALAASAGFPVVMLDVPPESGDRNGIVKKALERMAKARPPAYMAPDVASRIHIGNIDDDLELLADCDWIVEAIVELPEPKRELYRRLEAVCRSGAVITTNTSGIPIGSLSDGFSDAFRANFFGTHFFNPPRYLHLLEVIATPRTEPDVLQRFRTFAERHLGKGVVQAKDVPGFIANRLGIFYWVAAMRLMERHGLSIDEVDALTGTLIGRAKSATFRTADISGLDVVLHVVTGLSATTGEDFSLPPWVVALVRDGRVGEKAGAGFYRKAGKGIETLDWKTGEYRPSQPPALPELQFLLKAPLQERLRGLMAIGGAHAEFVRDLLLAGSHYTLEKTPQLADSLVAVDRALEWGYAWEVGPFRQMDAIGLETLQSALAARGFSIPPMLEAAQDSFYREQRSGSRYFTFTGEYAPVPDIPNRLDVDLIQRRVGTVDRNDDAAVLDIGDGVLLLEFRSKMNSIGEGVMCMLDAVIDRIATGAHTGLVIGNTDPRTFSAGADLRFVLQQAKDQNWAAIDNGVRAFQHSLMRLRTVPFPVVAAPFGMTLAGGAELVMHAARVQAHAELYMGLVEFGVGLLPAGGGTKELLFRFTEELAPYDEADPFEAVKRAFRLITMATTSGSALDARRLGFLRASDSISMNRDHLLADAKRHVLHLAPSYVAPAPRVIRTLGGDALGNLRYAAWAMHEAKQASDHDVAIANRIAYVLTGGDGGPRDVTEQDVLDLEREAFLSLLGTAETQQRIAHMLETGKPLRN